MEPSFPELDIILNRVLWLSDFHGVWGLGLVMLRVPKSLEVYEFKMREKG
jgi:hypothetical protein